MEVAETELAYTKLLDILRDVLSVLFTAIPPAEVRVLLFCRSIPAADPLQSNVTATDNLEFLLSSIPVVVELVASRP